MELRLFAWRRHLLTLVTGFISIVSFCGCVTSVSGEKIDPIQVQQIHERITTRAQVESIFGPPMKIDMLDVNQRMLTYWYREITVKGLTYVPLVGALLGGSDVRHQQLRVWIGTDDLVKDFQFTDVITDRQANFFTLVTKRAPVATQPTTGPSGPLIWYPGGEEGE